MSDKVIASESLGHALPECIGLSCDACSDPDRYYPSALLMYADGVASPNVFWWWHFPVDSKKDIPIRCNAHRLLTYRLVEHVKSIILFKENDNVAKGL